MNGAVQHFPGHHVMCRGENSDALEPLLDFACQGINKRKRQNFLIFEDNPEGFFIFISRKNIYIFTTNPESSPVEIEIISLVLALY